MQGQKVSKYVSKDKVLKGATTGTTLISGNFRLVKEF